MARGTVKWFNSDKGYGFIDPDHGEEEIFIHYSGIQGHGYRSLEAGQRVEYRLVRGAQGSRATAVRPEGSPEQLPVDRDRPRTADRPHGRTAGRTHRGQRRTAPSHPATTAIKSTQATASAVLMSMAAGWHWMRTSTRPAQRRRDSRADQP